MKLHSYTEMLRDMTRVITGDENGKAPDFTAIFPGIEHCRFHKLFSEVNPGRQRSSNVLEYLGSLKNVVPELDEEPDLDYELNVYRSDVKVAMATAEEYYAVKLKFVAKYNVGDMPMNLATSQDNPFLVCLVVDKAETTFWSIKTND